MSKKFCITCSCEVIGQLFKNMCYCCYKAKYPNGHKRSVGKGKEYRLTFGKKHNGKTLFQILHCDPQYILWLQDENILLIEEELYEKAKNAIGLFD